MTNLNPDEIKAAINAEKLRAAKADANLAETLAEAAELAHAKDLRRWLFDTASDAEERIFRFTGEVGPSSVHGTIDLLSRWDRLDNANGHTDRPYTIYFTSGGGQIMPGVSLHSFLSRLSTRRPVTTIASGFCASMATVLHQAGTIRKIERASSYLIHDASAGAYGDVHSLRDQAEWIDRINHDLHLILAEKSKLSVDEIAEKAKRRDWTLNAEQTVEYGFADAVV